MTRPLAFVLALAASAAARGDFLIYDPPGIPILVVLEGKTDKINRTYTLKTRIWPDELKFFEDTVTVYKSELPRDRLVKQLKAKLAKPGSSTPDDLWELGCKTLMSGAPGSFFEVAYALETSAPGHARAKAARELAAQWEAEIPESPAEEEPIRKLTPTRTDMKIHRTPHFLILHDIDTRRKKGEKVSRFERRCNLIERVYKSYLAFLCSKGRTVQLPKERMRVVFFAKESDFHAVADQIMEGDSRGVAGFYDRKLNASFFYDNSSTELYRKLSEQYEALLKRKSALQREGNFDMVQTTHMLGALKEIIREEQDMEVMSHEIIHHVSAETMLMPRDAPRPKWAAEGLACFFESPSDCTWSGIGAVNELRLKGMRAGAAQYSNQFDLDVVAKDLPFANAHGKPAETQIAYAHGWAFTHFMMNRHFDLIADFYGELAKLPRFDLHKMTDKQYAEYRRLYEVAFRKAIPPSRWRSLELEWKSYHSGLKTDFEVARAASTGSR